MKFCSNCGQSVVSRIPPGDNRLRDVCDHCNTIHYVNPRNVVGTDVFHAAILLWVAAIAHLFSGNVDLGLTATILIGSLPGVWLGTRLSDRLPERGLRPALGVVLLASGLALLTKAGVDIPAAVIIAVPVVAGAAAFLVLRARPPLAKPLVPRAEA